ncbi:MAG: hypothetical protein RLZZ180_177 [Pseudomonadota bacterium]|jgi:hypothetical protein
MALRCRHQQKPANRGNSPFENLRHCFFDAGGDTLVAFFEMPKDAKQLGDRDALATMQHRLGLALRRKAQVEADCTLAMVFKGLKVYDTSTSHSHRRRSELGQHRFHSTVRHERL